MRRFARAGPTSTAGQCRGLSRGFAAHRRCCWDRPRRGIRTYCHARAHPPPPTNAPTTPNTVAAPAEAHPVVLSRAACLQLLSGLVDQRLAAQAPQDGVLLAGDEVAALTALDELYEQAEEVFYSKRGYAIPAREQRRIDATGGSSTYGEVLPEGVQALLRNVPLGVDADDVFVDLGSGLGRVTLQVACTRGVRKAVGIELSASRMDQAEWVLKQLQARGLPHSAVELRMEDITSCNLTEGTHFMLTSTAFSASGCRQIVESLTNSPAFKVLVTSRVLPFTTTLRRIADFECAYSWNACGRAYVYTKPLPSAPQSVLARFLCDDGVAWLPTTTTLPLATPDL